MCKKNFIPISICFYVIALQSYREILKKYRKRAITLEKNIFQKFENKFLYSHIRNIMTKFQRSRLNGVAVIAKTYIHTHTHIHTYCRTKVIPKKNFLRWLKIGYFCVLEQICPQSPLNKFIKIILKPVKIKDPSKR